MVFREGLTVSKLFVAQASSTRLRGVDDAIPIQQAWVGFGLVEWICWIAWNSTPRDEIQPNLYDPREFKGQLFDFKEVEIEVALHFPPLQHIGRELRRVDID